MFEKSLVDLIRGLRGHKGREAEYIQSAIKECRAEIRSQDMDVKATALLKLIYLEMFGYDMTWAAFNVLEVMSAPKQMQKRVGYLGAVQSFRPDTDVLMLAENLLKKDLTSPSIPTLSLPLTTLPHIMTSSLALSILTDLLPRLSHSQPGVRKKTIATLYRLALVHPETLRVAWPKMKERLLDEQEDSTVTAATVNVICELGWRRPQDFLPLAPRLFDLLIDGGNNWMAIKIIKLFAVLTPLEPRLIKKLVRPLTNLIQTTTAMSLLYECISGIIQGGILDGADAGVEVEEVADLCISKLRGMVVVEGDPNLRYVALLAFNKIVISHPALVSRQEDVILTCLDDPDISIRLRALELAAGMVSSESLQSVVNRLLNQLANAPVHDKDIASGVEEENTDLEQKLVPDKRSSDLPPLPDEYRHEMISRIIDMSSKDTYANVTDFEWYLAVLVRLIRFLPASKGMETSPTDSPLADGARLADRVGGQLLDIIVRVKELRPESVKAAESLTILSGRTAHFSSSSNGLNEVLRSTAWACGEFASFLSSPYDLFNSLVHESSTTLDPATVAIIVQAIPKVFAHVAMTANHDWNASRRSTISLMLARAIEFLEKLSAHPNLEVQERSVEFLELLKICSEALKALPTNASEAPLLLISAIPNLFSGQELNPVAATAQSKVPMPEDLDLVEPINPELAAILQGSQFADDENQIHDVAFHTWYYERPTAQPVLSVSNRSFHPVNLSQPVPEDDEPVSYQAPSSPTTRTRLKAERLARTKDDPFYIPSGDSGTSTPSHQIHDIIARANADDDDLDIDSIPIVDLQIEHSKTRRNEEAPKKSKKKPARKFQIAVDETFDSPVAALTPTSQMSRSASRSPAPGAGSGSGSGPSSFSQSHMRSSRPIRNLLTVDSTSLGHVNLSLTDSSIDPRSRLDVERRLAEEAEMAAALKEVERQRLELARQDERKRTIYSEGVEEGGAIVTKKKKKKKAAKATDKSKGRDEDDEGEEEGKIVKVKKKKKKKVKAEGEAEE